MPKTLCLAMILVLASLSTCSAQHRSEHCLAYEPAIETLHGRIVRKTFAGPPNYASVRRGDQPETYWILVLDSPVCVNADQASDSNNGEQRGVRSLQLVLTDHTMYTRYASLVNKEVSATGTLFSAITGHHHLPLLLTVSGLSPLTR